MLLNPQLFQGRVRNNADRFLLKSQSQLDGLLRVDLSALSLPAAGSGADSDLPKGANRAEAGLAALNFLLNTIQNRCLIRIVENQVDKETGTVDLDLTAFRDERGQACFNSQTLGLVGIADDKSRCNNGVTRINELIVSMMQPDAYNAAQGLTGMNRSQVAGAFGVSEDKLDTFGNKLLVGTKPDSGEKESGVVGGTQRIIERQLSSILPGRMCYRSLDFSDAHEGGSGATSRSVEEGGIFFTHEAEEWLCIGKNGFLVTFLFDQKGNLLKEAPGSIASSRRLLKPSVRNVASCLDCHAKGFLAGTSDYSEQKDKIKLANEPTRVLGPNGQPLTHGDFFTTNAQYDAVAKQDSNLFVAAQKAAGAFLPRDNGDPVPLIPAAMDAHADKVTASVVARELKISESAAKEVLGSRSSISRTEFENNFCELKDRTLGLAQTPAKSSSFRKDEKGHNSK